jgi:6-phosphogluconolactonase
MAQDIRIFDSVDALAAASAELIISESAAADRYTLAFSGGTTPEKIYALWAQKYMNIEHWQKIRCFWSDERCVPPDDPESNYRMVRQTLLIPMQIPPDHIFRIYGEEEPEAEAKRYSEVLEREVPERGGIPSFDLVMLGIGEDGHTASIFPDRMSLFNSPMNCAVAEHPVSKQHRITFTGRILDAAQTILVLATGMKKAEIVKSILRFPQQSRQYPVSRLRTASGSVVWMLDKEAAAFL